ncbi:MAG TPA: hypothetical protein VM386_01375, partial [Acidimicrobiales bacterium]|nr:hypothetical protein [Acidimicrobiales bacterium]
SRQEVMAAIRERAALARASAPLTGSPGSGLPSSGTAASGSVTSGPAAALRRIPPLGLPVASGPVGRRLVKRLSRRLTAWQVDPVVIQVNRLHRAAADAVDAAAER